MQGDEAGTAHYLAGVVRAGGGAPALEALVELLKSHPAGEHLGLNNEQKGRESRERGVGKEKGEMEGESVCV